MVKHIGMESAKVEVAVRCKVYMGWGVGFGGVVDANLVIVGNLVGYPNIQVSRKTLIATITAELEF